MAENLPSVGGVCGGRIVFLKFHFLANLIDSIALLRYEFVYSVNEVM
jgi:hypothetical protein